VSVLDKLERRFGWLGIPNLMGYIVGLNALVYVLSYTSPGGALGRLALDPYLIMQGEVWRLVTFIFIPPATSILWIVFILYFYYIVGIGLEREWGSFRFTLYYVVGMAATIAAAFITGRGATALYLNLSLFLAFAHLYPNFEVLLFFIVPVKVKYLAWLNWAYIGFTVLTAPLAYKAAALVSIVNYFLFFGGEIASTASRRTSTFERRRTFQSNMLKKTTMHRCAVCNMTELDNPTMDFRYCSTCAGDYEYCLDHLKNHEHVKVPPPADS
jgi:hypothetical protein